MIFQFEFLFLEMWKNVFQKVINCNKSFLPSSCHKNFHWTFSYVFFNPIQLFSCLLRDFSRVLKIILDSFHQIHSFNKVFWMRICIFRQHCVNLFLNVLKNLSSFSDFQFIEWSQSQHLMFKYFLMNWFHLFFTFKIDVFVP